jgi:hypothetical protein
VATWKTVCDVLAALPGTALDPPDRMPAIRVAGKLVAYMPSTARSQPPHFGGDEVLVVRTAFDERAALIQEDPRTFAVTPHYETYPGVLVRLSTVPQDHLRELLIEAWRMVAPKRLVHELDGR